jgi:3D (Asp-Asp-Asp) domain-containing protein
LTETCKKIVAKSLNLENEKIVRTTGYYTPLFKPGSNGGLQKSDRYSCINMEGSCIVGSYLYNWSSKSEPWGKRYLRNEILFKFGKGSGESYYNTTNALDPCRTVAADPQHYPSGTVLYMPSMRGKICPQTGKSIDGCFIVGDVGSAIKGKGRFDFFTGECTDYNKGNNSCRDSANSDFHAPKETLFYVIGRHNILAKELREETDLFIRSDWRRMELPF